MYPVAATRSRCPSGRALIGLALIDIAAGQHVAARPGVIVCEFWISLAGSQDRVGQQLTDRGTPTDLLQMVMLKYVRGLAAGYRGKAVQ
ncbi:hypothetical protein [Tardiphaga sp.]|uniref:hypothetical protein n=1 Tax=Tardiphaga sp. TaxID=1926292 RepID=UPI0025E5564E|nr:hypothetical protein [Tardiphaga sp.]